jgi:hypothetical protein
MTVERALAVGSDREFLSAWKSALRFSKFTAGGRRAGLMRC